MGKPTRIFKLTNLDTGLFKENVRIADSENITERHIRSIDYNSVLRIDTIPLMFPRDGGRIFDYGGYYFILDAKEQYGVKARIQLDIERLNPYTDGYDPSFTGVLEFNPNGGFKKEDEFISVKVVDSRKLAKFKERDEIEYNVFDLLSSDNVTVPAFTNPYTEATYLPIDVYLIAELINGVAGTTLPAGEIDIVNETDINLNPASLFFRGNTSEDEIGDRLNFDQTRDEIIYTNTLDSDSLIHISHVKSSTELTWVWTDFSGGTNNGQGFYFLNIIHKDDEDNTLGTYLLDNNESVYLENLLVFTTRDSSAIVDKDVDIDITLQSGDTLSLVILFSAITTDLNMNVFGVYDNFELSIYEKTEGWEQNQIRGMYPYEVGSRLIQLTTSETDTSKLINSSILGRTNSEFQTYPSDGSLSREFATNGYQLRQLTDRALNISFKDWFRSLSAISPIGMWYDKSNDYFVIEDIEQFYKAELFPINLGQPKDIKTTDFKELYFNSILSGYPKTDYEDFQGVNEVNTLTEHEISIEVKNKFDARSTLYGDSQGQEQARRKNISKYASQDTKYDKKVYLTTLDTSNETIQGDLTDLIGFLGLSQSYNLRKTSRQNLQRQAPLLLAPIYKGFYTEFIVFRNSAKDTNISYRDPLKGFIVNEFDRITQVGLRARLIDPELDEFEGLYTEAIANAITSDPHRIMPYYDREDNLKYGYIWDIEGNRITGKAQYRLIKCNPDRVP